MSSDQQIILDSLKNEAPEAWLQYLRPFEAGEPATGLSMQVIYHFVAPLATKQGRLDWAEVAVRAAEVEARQGTGIEREDAQVTAMMLRSLFVSKMGPRPGHPVLDKEVILRWVAEGLSISVQEARQSAIPFWKNLIAAKTSTDPEDLRRLGEVLRELRRIKRRLNGVPSMFVTA